MKIMAIDYGDAHTGVAISDRTLTLTGFSTVITAYQPEAVIEKLLPLISEHEVSELVLGHPLNMDGTRGPAQERPRASPKCCARPRRSPSRYGMSAARPSTHTISYSITASAPRSARRRSMLLRRASCSKGI